MNKQELVQELKNLSVQHFTGREKTALGLIRNYVADNDGDIKMWLEKCLEYPTVIPETNTSDGPLPDSINFPDRSFADPGFAGSPIESRSEEIARNKEFKPTPSIDLSKLRSNKEGIPKEPEPFESAPLNVKDDNPFDRR